MIRMLVLLSVLVLPWLAVSVLIYVAESARKAGRRAAAGGLVAAALTVALVWVSWFLSAPVVVDGLDAPLFGGWW